MHINVLLLLYLLPQGFAFWLQHFFLGKKVFKKPALRLSMTHYWLARSAKKTRTEGSQTVFAFIALLRSVGTHLRDLCASRRKAMLITWHRQRTCLSYAGGVTRQAQMWERMKFCLSVASLFHPHSKPLTGRRGAQH